MKNHSSDLSTIIHHNKIIPFIIKKKGCLIFNLFTY